MITLYVIVYLLFTSMPYVIVKSPVCRFFVPSYSLA